MARQRILGLPQRGEILNQVGELLKRHRRVQSFGHERNVAAALCFDVARGDADQLAVRPHQFDPGVGDLLHDAEKFLACFGLDRRGTVADGNV